MRVGEIPWAAMTSGDLYCHAFGEMLSQMLLCELENLVAFLLRNETKRQFCHRMTGDHRLSPLPLITAADSVDLGSRPRPDPLHRIVPRFAEKLRHACFLENQFVAIDRKLPPCFALPIFQRLHAIVKSRDGHTTLAIVKRGQQLCERGNRIRNGASYQEGMLIHF